MADPRIGGAVITVGADASGFQTELGKQTTKAAQSTGEKFSNIMGKGLRAGAVATGGAVAGVLGAALVEGFKRLNAIDDATSKLQGLGHSAAEVKTIMNNALTSVKGTAYGLGDAATQAASLVASGIKPGKDLTRTLTLLADTASISGASLGEVGAIFGKVAAGGKLTTEVLNQLQTRGVPVLKFLADQTGKSMAQVAKDITAGKISFATFQAAMEKGLGGAAKTSGDSFVGALANVNAALGRFGAALLGGAFSQMPALFKTLIGWIDQVTPAAERVGAKIGAAFTVAVGWVTSFKTGLSGLSGSSSPWAPIAAGIGGLAIILGHFLSGTKSLTAFMEGLTGKTGKLASVLKAVIGPVGIVAGLFVYAYTTSKPFRDAINALLGTLGDLAGQIATALVPVFATLLGTFGEAAKVVLPILAGALSVVVGALQVFTPLIVFLAPKIVIFLVAMRTAGLIIQGVGVAFRILTAIMETNPFVLILVAVAALAAGIYWVATRTQFFQTVWAAVWGAVKAVTAATVGWFTTSVWPVMQAGIGVVVTAFQWLSTTVTNVWGWISRTAATFWAFLQPIFAAIGDVVGRVLVGYFNIWWGVAFRVFQAIQILALAWWKVVSWVFDQAKAGLGFLGAVFSWLYTAVVKPVFGFIRAVIVDWWATGVTPVFNNAKAGIGWLGDKFTWLYRAVVLPIWAYIRTTIATAWSGISVIFTLFKSGIGFVGDKIASFYSGTVKPTWDRVGAIISTVWNVTISKIFTAMKTGVSLVGIAFTAAKDAIGIAWNKLKAIAAAPIHFILDTVINKGLIAGFNWLSGKVGGPTIDNVPVPFAQGGVMPGYTPGRDVHRFTSPTGGALNLSGGEAVMVPEWTRAVGGAGAVRAMNQAARSGRDIGGSFADGGIIGWIKKQAAGTFNWVADKAGKTWQALSNPMDYIKKLLPAMPGGSFLADMGPAVVAKAGEAIKAKISSLFSVFNTGFNVTEAERMAATGPSGFGPQFVGTGTGSGWPVRGPITAPFGRYRGSGRPHRGIDIGVPTGTLVHAFRSGLVNFAGWDNTGFGNLVRLSHGAGIMSYYGHNQRVLVKAGQAVFAGQGISISDSTGNSTGPHVHFEIKQNGVSVNPLPYLAGKGAARGGGSSSGSWRKGGVLDPFLADQGVTLGRGLNLLNNQTGGPEPLRRADQGGGNVTVYMNVSVDDLAKMSNLAQFMDMIQSARVDQRRTRRSGMVTAP